ncbi:MAG: AAA family ATPase [Planctomycetota bacterium]|nr:AAA family ATPase [Planctomycetota bacterium]
MPSSVHKPLIILDEIHKDRTWKRTLKGIYDTSKFEGIECDFFVTGSARLNVYRRGSDSLWGRYNHFRLAPFSLREMQTPDALVPDDCLEKLWHRSLSVHSSNDNNLQSLLKFGPFPEPLFRQNIERRNDGCWDVSATEAQPFPTTGLKSCIGSFLFAFLSLNPFKGTIAFEYISNSRVIQIGS